MKKNMRIILCLVLAISTLGSFAQKNIADKVIEKLVHSLRDPNNVELNFNYYYQYDADNASQKQTGQAVMQHEEYKITLNEQHILCDGKFIWTYLAKDEEVMISLASEGTDNTPFKIFTTLDQDYTAKFIGVDDQKQTQIQLTNPKGQFKKLIVTTGKDGSLKKAEIVADDGSTMNIEVTEIKTNQDLGEHFFTFDEKAYPNAEIIDMR